MQNLISDAGHLWVFAAFFIVHLTEEFWGGKRSFDPHKMHGLDLSRKGFIRINAVALAALLVVMVLAQQFGFPQFLLVSLGAFVLINGTRHAATSIKQVTYSPGLVTGLLVFIPLGILTLVRLEPNMSSLRFGAAVGTGLVMQFGASFVGHKARQLVRRGKQEELAAEADCGAASVLDETERMNSA